MLKMKSLRQMALDSGTSGPKREEENELSVMRAKATKAVVSDWLMCYISSED